MKSRQKIFALFCVIVSLMCFFSCKHDTAEELPDDTPKTASYTVKHMQQAVSGDSYVEVEADRQVLGGKVGELTAAEAKNYTGFTAKTVTQKTITADGNTIVEIEYDRKTVSLAINLNGGTTTTSLTGGKLTGRYGAPVSIATPTKAGYTFKNWTPALPATFLADGSYKAEYTANAPDTANYTVKHMQQDVTGFGYTEVAEDRETKNGNIGALTVAAAKTYTGFNAQSVTQKTIKADGSTVVEIKYDRKAASLTIDLDGGTTTTTLTGGKLTGRYGAPVTITTPTKSGYNFKGWSPALPATFISDASFKALWISDSITETGFDVTFDSSDIKITSVMSAENVTFTADDGYTNYEWYVNGKNGVQGTSRVYVLNTASLPEDCYTVTVRAEKNGLPSSGITSAVLDKTAPAKVSGLSVTSVNTSTNKVSLSWTNPSDSDFKKVKVYWTESSGEKSQEVSGTAASTDVTVVNAGNNYEFRVTSIDEFGNESSAKTVASNMVIKIASDGTYVYKTGEADPDGTSRFETKLNVTGFNYAAAGTKFSFKFKFTDYETGSVSKMYVRTDKDKFLYYGEKNGTTLTELTGDWAGWYEVSGTIATAGASKFFIVFNHEDDVAFTNDDTLYIADFKCSPSGGGELTEVKNSDLSVASNGTITPVKSYVTLSNAN